MFEGKRPCRLLLLAAFAFATAANAKPQFTPRDRDDPVPAGKLGLGHWVGYIDLTERAERVAVTFDTYIEQPDDLVEFPKLNAILKVGLGGYGTSEYVAENFENVRYDFSSGLLSLDEPENDLVVTAKAYSIDGADTLRGDVFVRSAAVSGTINVVFQSDEPGGRRQRTSRDAELPMLPLLQGEYRGKCGDEAAAMVIQTVKGLPSSDPSSRGLHDYGIFASLGFGGDPRACATGSGPTYCVYRSYGSGSYSPFAGKLVLKDAGSSDECRLQKGELHCRVRLQTQSVECSLRRTSLATAPSQTYQRGVAVEATSAQQEALPAPSPPENAQLVAALRGDFAGFLHNEQTNRYQAMGLHVDASTSTENPHNENLVYVTSTAILHFGRDLSGDFWTQQMERRSFYLRTGFVLESPESDGFLEIKSWTMGYIEGVWYSHAYGRVGTVQLVKGSLPALPASAAVVPSVAGEFQGPQGLSSAVDGAWWFKLFYPTQPLGRTNSTVLFQGDIQLRGGLILPFTVREGRYDSYSGALGWVTEEPDGDRIINGTIDTNENVSLIWPGSPKYVTRLPEFRLYPYPRVGP